MEAEMPKGKHKKLTKKKARKILRHGEVRGHPLTEKQKGFFGARAGGAPVKRVVRKPAKKADHKGIKKAVKRAKKR